MTGRANEPHVNVAAGLAWSALVLAAMIAASLWAWDVIPDGARVPTHWNERGEIDGYWSKANGLAFAPTIAAIIALVFAAVPILGRRRDLTRSPGFYHGLWTAMMLVFAAVHAKIIAAATAGAALPSMLVMIPLAFVVAALATMAASFLRRARHG